MSAISSDQVVTIVVYVGIALLVLILHTFICVWILRDSRNLGRRGGGWAAFGAIPVIGLVGLFSYIFTRSAWTGGRFTAGGGYPPPVLPPDPDPVSSDPYQEATVMENMDYGERLTEPRIVGGNISAPASDPTRILRVRPGTIVQFIQIGGDGHGQVHHLRVGVQPDGRRIQTKIGRGVENGVVVHDPAVSTSHCTVYEEEGRLIIQDLASENGTLFAAGPDKPAADGWRRIDREELRDGSWIKLGETVFRVLIVRERKKSGPAVPAE